MPGEPELAQSLETIEGVQRYKLEENLREVDEPRAKSKEKTLRNGEKVYWCLKITSSMSTRTILLDKEADFTF